MEGSITITDVTLNLKHKFRYLSIVIVGIINGAIPVLIGSTLNIFLKEYGLSLKTIGLFSLAQIPYAFSFLFCIIIEFINHATFIKYKHSLIISYIFIGIAVFAMPNLVNKPSLLFITCLIISISGTISRMIAQSMQLLLFEKHELTSVINILSLSYRVGILFAASFALYLSQYLSWQIIYRAASLIILTGSLILILMPSKKYWQYEVLHGTKQSFVNKLINSVKELLHYPQITVIALIMLFYRAPDNMITHYLELYYLNLGFSKTTVAFGYKLYGLFLAALAGFTCKGLVNVYSYKFNLILVSVLHLISYSAILIFNLHKPNIVEFYIWVTLEEFTRGMTMIIFWSFQSMICNRQYALMQLTILTGIDSLSFSLFSTVGGYIIHSLGYNNFLGIVILSFIPGIIASLLLRKSINTSI